MYLFYQRLTMHPVLKAQWICARLLGLKMHLRRSTDFFLFFFLHFFYPLDLTYCVVSFIKTLEIFKAAVKFLSDSDCD